MNPWAFACAFPLVLIFFVPALLLAQGTPMATLQTFTCQTGVNSLSHSRLKLLILIGTWYDRTRACWALKRATWKLGVRRSKRSRGGVAVLESILLLVAVVVMGEPLEAVLQEMEALPGEDYSPP